MITTSLEAALLILSIELIILAPVLLFIAYRRERTAAAAVSAGATELVAKVSDTEEARRGALVTVFRDKYKFDGDELQRAVDEFMLREKAFYNAVVGAVLGRGDTKLADISDELTKVVAPWISITPKNMVDADSANALENEKLRLEQELTDTKHTLENMIAEYNRAFEGKNTQAEQADEGESVDISLDVAAEEDDTAAPEYVTEELTDLDEVLEGLDDDEIAEPSATADPVEIADESAVRLDEESAEEPDAIAELEELDSLEDDDFMTETPSERAEKPMTADDLDELMESLEAEPESATETA